MYLSQFNDHTKAAQRLRDRIKQLGTTLDGKRLWTDEEDDMCRRLYPDYVAMSRSIPDRTKPALKSRCRDLAITRSRNHFTARDIKTMRAAYPSLDMPALLKLMPGRTAAVLHAKASDMGLTRPKPQYKPTGNYLLDALRQRCFEEGYTMSDLDEYVKKDRYFRRRHWCGPRGVISYTHIVRAIHELGGRLRIEWSDAS